MAVDIALICAARDCGKAFVTHFGGKGRPRTFCSHGCNSREDYNRHRDRHLATKRIYSKKNRELLKVKTKKYRDANRARVYAKSAQWHILNSYRSGLRSVRRRILKLQTDPTVRLTELEWQDIQRKWKHRCAYCRKKLPLTQDHLTPLTRGGSHTAENIAPACQSCNSKKSTKTYEEYMRLIATQ